MQETSQDKSPIKLNISKYLAQRKVSKYRFYIATGISRGTLSNTSGLTEENIQKFLAFAQDINIDWLFTGMGEMLKYTPENSENYRIGNNTKEVFEAAGEYKTNRIPLYDLKNPADVAGLFESRQSTAAADYIQIPNVDNCDGALTITGDNMDPLLRNGDIVVYKNLKDKSNSWLWGKMYVLVITVEDEQMVMLNFVQKSEKGDDHISLKSFNPTHQQKDIRIDQVIAFALVKASVRIN